jgi:hypothetical protein
MTRLSIEIPERQCRQIKAMAALRGVSIKEYILSMTLPQASGGSESEALAKLEKFLAPRVEAAERGEVYVGGVEEILSEVHSRRRRKRA